MRKMTIIVLPLLLAFLICSLPAQAGTLVSIDTSYGEIKVELDEAKAPQ